jgi:predicted ATPase/DNA-binding CsgD family transcriptional regulator
MSFPNQPTTFVGREREIAEVLTAARRSRLVTLTGPGGIGKTRLALEAARRLQEQDEIVSVYFVDLATVPEADRLEAAVVVAMGGNSGDRGTSLESIVDVLADPRSLLVIDNCERLINPTARTVELLLRGTRSLSIFATSREPLDIAGEARYAVPSLNDDDGVRLFIERARLFIQEPSAMDESKSAILQLCRGLDGLPLAIELAAARVSHLPVAEIVSRLDDRFRLLTRSSRNAVPRHQSLQSAIGWSFDLLDEIEQTAFASLSLFAGGFDEPAAQGVADCSLDGLGRLVDKSMVIAYTGKDGRARYRLLETMRQFAFARLQNSGRPEEVERRHFRYFATLARQVAGEIHGPGQGVWIERLDEELSNVRLALQWGSDHDPDAALAMAADLIWFWHHRGHNQEGRSWLKRLSATASSSPPEVVATALTQAADFAFLSGDRATAVAELDHTLTLWRQLGDPAGISRTLVARAVSDGPSLISLVGQRRALEEAVAEARRAGQDHLLVEALTFLGHAEGNAGNVERCVTYLHEAEATARRSGDVWRQALVLHELGCVDEERGKLDSAAASYEESLKLQRIARSSLITGGTHVRLGFVRLLQNREEEARKHFEAALTAEGLALPEAGAVRGFSLLAGRRGSYQRALKLHGAYSSMPFFGWRSEATQLEMQPWITSARRALGHDAADAIWRSGARMSASEALGYALSDADEPPPDDGPLTAREREIAALVGRGRRNREIATQLYISPRTVEAHLEHIRNKLGYQSRSEVAAWANERGLLKGERV